VFVGWEGFEPYFNAESTATIEKNSSYCVDLEQGQSVVIPLFLDNKMQHHKDFLTEAKFSQLEHFDKSKTEGFSATITPFGSSAYFGIFAFLGDDVVDMVGMISQKGTDFSVLRDGEASEEWNGIFAATSTARKYLTVLNGEVEKLNVCIKSS
jgi:hypothetical protein